jgi:hypothetical protein
LVWKQTIWQTWCWREPFFVFTVLHFSGKCFRNVKASSCSKPSKEKLLRQGDQIGLIFASLAMVYFGQPFENDKIGLNFGATFFCCKSYAQIDTKNGLGYIHTFWAIFHLIWSHWTDKNLWIFLDSQLQWLFRSLKHLLVQTNS